MAKYTQANRPMRVTTGLGQDVLLLQGFAGEEGISTPFSYTLDLWSENASIDPQQLLGNPVCVTLDLPGSAKRIIHGRVSRFMQSDRRKDLIAYRAQVVPWLWFLSLSSDSKIFQQLSVLEIAENVFKAHGYSDFQIKCGRSYAKREYCVQYRETDLNFVSRLLEEEGIFYFFEHANDKHTLILGDDSSRVDPCPGQATARLAAHAGAWQEEDVVTVFELEHAVHVGKVTLRDYDYLQPTVRLETSVSGNGTGEVYEYPGSYAELGGAGNAPQVLERYARLQLEEREAWRHIVRGGGTCRSFLSGHSFDLREHYRSNANQTYRLLHVQHTAHSGDYETGEAGNFAYHNSFLAIPRAVPFRPPRMTPKPIMQGSQTAIVVGKSGEEMWVDRHGRVNVQFHWDRNGNKNESSSCPVRVATSWAGKNWGFIQIPRIGQEVIVDFLEGDPDRPIITGRVYNADQPPPYPLPANQTQSGVKSRSSKGGGTDNFNEIRFEDKKGSEEILVHAEKDLKTEIENDETHNVDHDRTSTVKNNDTREVTQGNDALTIKQGNQTVVLEMGNQQVTLKQGNQEVTLSMGNQVTKLDLGKISHEAMQGIELKVGQSTIKVDQTGVTIKGLNVSIEGQVQTEVKGVMTNIKGDGMLVVKGGITMIN